MNIYTIKKLPYVEGFVMHYIYKTATKKQLPALLKDGWEIVQQQNVFIYHVEKISNKLSYGEKFTTLITLMVFALGLLANIIL